MKYINLNYLLSEYFNNFILPNINILNISDDSRLVKKDYLFIAIKGHYLDGRNFIFNAILNGAISVLTYSNINKSYYIFDLKYKIWIFYLFNLNFFISDIANKFYDYPSKKLILTGVTGTNGKTTVVNFCSQWLYLLGYKTSLLSTIGNGFYNNLHSSKNTTSSAIETQYQLKKQYDKGSEFVSVEVSSHSLIQYRVKSLKFSSVIFTNLTLDHLDYHNNMNNYELAKLKLFTQFNVKNLIINIDDNIGFKWCNLLSKKYIIPVSFKKNNFILSCYRWIFILNIEYFGFLKKIYFNSSWGNGILNVFFVGIFNIKNLLLSFVSLLSLGYNFKDLINSSKYLILPKGRMEFFTYKNKPLIIIDYAHTPDAFKKVLLESRKYCFGKLWCVFGCTGNRDKSKRSLMGYISVKYSDFVIITNDDLYNEDEKKILNDIKLGINNFNNVFIILNRILAIKFSIENSNYNDVILILGKGHENFIIVKNNKKILYSDRKLINSIFENYLWDD